MAVFTQVPEAELQTFLADYEVGELLSFKGIAEGVQNSNFLLQTRGARLILTLFERGVDTAGLPFFLGLMQHLAKSGIACPQPLVRRDGQLLGQLSGRPATLVTFLDGQWPRQPEAHHCQAVGQVLAQLHQAGSDFPLQRANDLGPAAWQPLWAKCASGAGQLAAGLRQTIDDELHWLAGHWPATLPGGIIHADLFPDNVFFQGDRLSGLLDFYFACHDLLAYDLAICLNAWCFDVDGGYRKDKGRALLAGYQSVRPLTEAENHALPLLARGAALRFLLTRLHDWLHTPADALVVKKDPLEYLHRLHFHQRIQDAGAYT